MSRVAMLREAVEDSFLEALEAGADPPCEFTVRLPAKSFALLKAERVHVAGFTITFADDEGRTVWETE